MFGQNAVSHKFQLPDGSLLVNDVWYTLQGEGPDAGKPAVFVRLAKCNLRCYFCDTEFEQGEKHSMVDLSGRILDLAFQQQCRLIVITGGEPLLQNICPLVCSMNGAGRTVAIETAGTMFVPGMEHLFKSNRSYHDNLVVCSPKTPTLDQNLIPLIGAYKYLVRTGEVDPEDGLPSHSTQIKAHKQRLYRPDKGSKVPIYLSPIDEGTPDVNLANARLAARLVLQYGYRMTVQMHKIVDLP